MLIEKLIEIFECSGTPFKRASKHDLVVWGWESVLFYPDFTPLNKIDEMCERPSNEIRKQDNYASGADQIAIHILEDEGRLYFEVISTPIIDEE